MSKSALVGGFFMGAGGYGHSSLMRQCRRTKKPALPSLE
jgi:hypothetical protein